MEKATIIRAFAFLSAFGSIFTGVAQTNKVQKSLNPKTLMESATNMINAEDAAKKAFDHMREINPKLLKNFLKYFNDATEIKVNEKGRYTFIFFKSGGSDNRAAFDFHGRLLYSIRYLSGSNIPKEVKKIVEGEFRNYEIMHGTEVTVQNRKVFLINIENGLGYKVIRFVNNEFDVYKEFVK